MKVGGAGGGGEKGMKKELVKERAKNKNCRGKIENKRKGKMEKIGNEEIKRKE
jgi:hypothetical protein